ncbi:hypothetical protein HRR86_009610 [Exophiala dermatitidis]|nr:hypothetical protein HRR82_009603 [Exophiala dermatitidis]KAJ4611927.1 hypothetical protein HRR85_009622 [Exophiala dermatitidis]KAJ4632560.1 hypothetical protein HRR86_009610 [Exophiala dermatitidis]
MISSSSSSPHLSIAWKRPEAGSEYPQTISRRRPTRPGDLHTFPTHFWHQSLLPKERHDRKLQNLQ